MKYLLDTNICIYLLNGNAALNEKVANIGISSLSITNSVLAELYFGAFNSRRTAENLDRIKRFKKNLNIMPDSEASAEIFGRIKSNLKSKGRRIDDFDILIASIALKDNYTIVTNNLKHFSQIDGLKIENWLNLDKEPA